MIKNEYFAVIQALMSSVGIFKIALLCTL